MRNHSYENDFDMHEHRTACRTHFHTKGFGFRLVLKQRHKRTWKWPIKECTCTLREQRISFSEKAFIRICIQITCCTTPVNHSLDLQSVSLKAAKISLFIHTVFLSVQFSSIPCL